MKTLPKFLSAAILIAAAVAVLAPSPGASSEHFIIINDNDGNGNNYGTVLRLAGTKQNPTFTQSALLGTGIPSSAQLGSAPTVQVVRAGADICVFLVDSTPDGTPEEISSFKYPGKTLVGNYNDGEISNPDEKAVTIAARSGFLFASYYGWMATNYLATWQIGSGCTLTLLGTYEIPYPVFSMAATPSGNALLVSYTGGGYLNGVDSFAIGSGGVVTETGPYSLLNATAAWGLDITADSKMAVFTMQGFGPPYDDGETEINVFVINSDGSLGQQGSAGGDGSLGDAYGGGWIRFSPDEKFLFVTDDSTEVTTLNFQESPLQVTWSGCLTTLNMPGGGYAGSITNVGMSGAGSGIYVSESNGESPGGRVALLSVNSATGCTKEEPSSPFSLSDAAADPWSLVAWPPRPF